MLRVFKLIFFVENKGSGDVLSFVVLCIVLVVIVGIGNIVGVVIVIKVGGFGVFFWMWIVVFFGMVIKYLEGVFVIKYRIKDKNG